MTRKESDLSLAKLLETLSYDPETGFFTWRVTLGNGGMAGSIAGGTYQRYRTVRIDGRSYLQHRLAWLYTMGRWPTAEIDHINGDGTDNRIVNLREASRTENVRNARRSKNNTSGYKGVYFNNKIEKWISQITVDRQCTYLGCFYTPEAAYAAYCAAAKKYHGKFARFA